MSTSPNFKRANFVDGQEAYKAGDSVVDVIEHMAVEASSGPSGEDNAVSFFAGFCDGLVSDIRRAAKPRSLDLTLNINVTGHLDDDAKLSLMQAIEAGIEKAVRL